jgi:hypothetical protein
MGHRHWPGHRRRPHAFAIERKRTRRQRHLATAACRTKQFGGRWSCGVGAARRTDAIGSGRYADHGDHSTACGRRRVGVQHDFVQTDQVFSGWPLGPQQDVDIELQPNGYAITGAGRYVSLVAAPVDQSYNQIEVSAQAMESTNPPQGAAFGVFCALGGVAYTFDVNVDGTWSIRRGAAPEIFETRDTSIAVAHGSAGRSPASGTAISGVCATLPGGTSVRLAMFVNGAKVADLLDTQAANGIGWRAGIVSTDSDLSSSTTTFVSFAETAFGISDQPTPTQLPSPADSFGVQT